MEIEEKKRLLMLMEAMADTATDIFWGGDLEITIDEQEDLNESDYTEAYREACLECVAELAELERSWFTDLYINIADRYGKHLKTRLLKNQLDGEVE